MFAYQDSVCLFTVFVRLQLLSVQCTCTFAVLMCMCGYEM